MTGRRSHGRLSALNGVVHQGRSAADLEQKLAEFKDFYNSHRAHTSLEGRTPVQTRKDVATLNRYRWEAHCRGLYQTPIAA